MPRVSLDQIRSFGDISQGFRWILNIVQAPAAVPFPNVDALDLRVETSELPKKSSTSVEINLKGHVVKHPGQWRPVGSLAMTFIDTLDNLVLNWLASWRTACWNNNTGIRVPKRDLEAVFQIQLLRNDDTPRYQYTMKGVFIEDTTTGSVDGTTVDPHRPQLVVSYDDFTEGPL
jgi:hypothetical protein